MSTSVVQVAAVGCGRRALFKRAEGFHVARTTFRTTGQGRQLLGGASLVAAAAADVDGHVMSSDRAVSGVHAAPIVKIDNRSDPFATVVSIKFGEELGELLDTVQALKNLGLNIRRAKLDQSDAMSKHKFFITDEHTSEKIIKSARLEEIRMTVLENMMKYHPESSEMLGVAPRKPRMRDPTLPLGPEHRMVVNTTIEMSEDPSGSHTRLFIRTKDRAGLLVDIVSVLKDLNVNVVSAEVDTEGDEAQDEFFVTYRGEPLNESMSCLVTNALQYYLSLGEIEREESY